MSYSTYFTTWDKNPYDEIIDLINNNSPKTVGYIKTQPEYNDIFSDIMFIIVK